MHRMMRSRNCCASRRLTVGSQQLNAVTVGNAVDGLLLVMESQQQAVC